MVGQYGYFGLASPKLQLNGSATCNNLPHAICLEFGIDKLQIAAPEVGSLGPSIELVITISTSTMYHDSYQTASCDFFKYHTLEHWILSSIQRLFNEKIRIAM